MTPNNPDKHNISPAQQFVSLLLSQLDSQPSSTAPIRRKPANTGNDAPPALMRRATAEKVAALAKSIDDKFFRLTPGQVATLESIAASQALPQKVIDAVLSVNYMFKDHTQHQTNGRLDILRTIPESDPDSGLTTGPDWPNWWLKNADAYIGIHFGKNLQEDPFTALLDQAVYATGKAASLHPPSPALTAFNRSRYNRTSNNRTKPTRPTLTDAWAQLNALHRLGQGLLLTSQDLHHMTYSTPEQVDHTLKAEGISLLKDAGTFHSLKELREQTEGIPLHQLEIIATQSLWLNITNQRNTTIGPTRYATGLLPPPHTKLTPDSASDQMPLSQESELLLITAPYHPALTDGLLNHHDHQADKAAWLTATTPNQATEYLLHRTDDPSPPKGLTKCPLIQHCATHCADLQTKDRIAFPLTPDGSHQSCLYMAFLSTHKGSPQDIRETAAHHTLRVIYQQPPPAPGPPLKPNQRSKPSNQRVRPLQPAML